MKSLVVGATVRRLYSRGPDYLIIAVDSTTETLKLLNLETSEIRFDFPDDWAPVTPVPLNWITTTNVVNPNPPNDKQDDDDPKLKSTVVQSIDISPPTPVLATDNSLTQQTKPSPSLPVPTNQPGTVDPSPSFAAVISSSSLSKKNNSSFSSPSLTPPTNLKNTMGNDVSTTINSNNYSNNPSPNVSSDDDDEHVAMQQQAYQQLHPHHQQHTNSSSSSSSSSTELQRSTLSSSSTSTKTVLPPPSVVTASTFTPWPGIGTKVQFPSSSLPLPSFVLSSRNGNKEDPKETGLKSILKVSTSGSTTQDKDDTDDDNDDANNGTTANSTIPGSSNLLSSLPTVSKSKRKREKKKTKVSTEGNSNNRNGQRHVRWGNVQIRELKRAIGRSSSIPYYSQAEWIFSLSDIIIDRDENGNMIELEREPDDPMSTLFTKKHNSTYEEIEDSEDEAILKAATVSSKSKHGGNAVGSPIMKGGSSPRMGSSNKSSSNHHHHGKNKSTTVPPSPSMQRMVSSPQKGAQSNELRSSPEETNLSIDHEMEPLDLGDSSITAVQNLGKSVTLPVLRRKATTLGIRTIGTVDQLEQWREKNLAERLAALSPTDRLTCTGETRQMSHRHGKGAHYNPLFDYIPVKTRQEIIARDLNISNGLHADKYVRKNLIESQITDVILAARKSVGCSCAEMTEKSFKKDSLKEVQAKASALQLSIDGTKGDIITRIIQWYVKNQLCNKFPTYGLEDDGLSSSCSSIEPTIHHHDGAQGTPDLSIINGEHNPLDPGTAYIRGQTLEVEVDEDQWNYLVNGIPTSVSTIVNRSPNYSPIVTTMPSSSPSSIAVSGTGSTESPFNKYAELRCPCVLEGIGCHYDLCKCNLDDCRNRWRLHATAYTYDDDGVDEYRRQLLALLKEENKEYITDDDVPKVYSMMKHHFDTEREKQIKKDQLVIAKKERKAEEAAEKEAERLRAQAEEEQERIAELARIAQEEAMARAAALAYAQYQEELEQEQEQWEEKKKKKPVSNKKPTNPPKPPTITGKKEKKETPVNTVITEEATMDKASIPISKTETETVNETSIIDDDIAVIGEITVTATTAPTNSSPSRNNRGGGRSGRGGRDRNNNNASAMGTAVNDNFARPNQRRGNYNNKQRNNTAETIMENNEDGETASLQATVKVVRTQQQVHRERNNNPNNQQRYNDGHDANTLSVTEVSSSSATKMGTHSASITETVPSSPSVSPHKNRSNHRPRADSGPNIPSGYGAKHHGGELQVSLNTNDNVNSNQGYQGGNDNTVSSPTTNPYRNRNNGGRGRGGGGSGGGGRGGHHRNNGNSTNERTNAHSNE